MSRKQTLWLGSALWGAAFAVSGAFAFAMNQPLMHHYDVFPTSIERIEQNEALVETRSSGIRELTFDPIEITVPRAALTPPAESAPAAQAEPAYRDITQMNCGAPRPLEQGSNTVRECQ